MPNSPGSSSRTARVLCAAALSGCFTTAAFAKDNFVAAAQVSESLSVPNADINCQPTTEHPGLTARGDIVGTGLATTIGIVRIGSSDCLRSDVPGQFVPPFHFSSSVLTLTSAGGDTIVASYSGTAELNDLGLLVLTGTYQVTGGTGVFRKARGSGALTGVENVITQPATGFVTLHGQLSY